MKGSDNQLISLRTPPPLLPTDLKQGGGYFKIGPEGRKFWGILLLGISISLRKIVFAKCKTAKFFRLRRATNAKTTINMNKRHIYYLNVFFQPAAGGNFFGSVLTFEPPPPPCYRQI